MEIKKQFYIRHATEEDMDGIMRAEKDAWPNGLRANRDEFESRLRIFSQGFFIACIKVDEDTENIVGISTSEIINYDTSMALCSWKEVTDNGYIEDTHDENGNALYIVSVGVSEKFRGMGIGTNIINAQKQLSIEKNLDYIVAGARIMRYKTWSEKEENKNKTVMDYVFTTNEKCMPIDPILRFFFKMGFRMPSEKIEKSRKYIIPHYMEGDSESKEYGAILAYNNKG